MKQYNVKYLLSLAASILLAACGDGSGGNGTVVIATKVELGERLYSDVNLSLNKTQSCASCHNLQHGLIDNRLNAFNQVLAVSLGDDGISKGVRNAPTAGYASFSPDFVVDGERIRPHRHNNNKTYQGALGGQFLDGREADLKGQAGGPPLNPVEMGMPDKASVVARLQEDTVYVTAFRQIYGESIFDDVDAAYAAMAESIAEFEKTEVFAPFDSKYDRSLRGDYTMSFMELTGKSLFFSQHANCNVCHQLHSEGDVVNKFAETFTGYEYHNIGVPQNTVDAVPGPDNGLFANPLVSDSAQMGKFKTPTLRNVAVTEPYMHNGVFRDLKTVVEFYMHQRDSADVNFQNNPETGLPWATADVPQNITTKELGMGDQFTALQVEAMVCFLRTLTDQQYEALIEDKGIHCQD